MIRITLLVTLLTASTAFAQPSEFEFGRAFGGEIKGTAKPNRNFSGSLGLTRGNSVFGDRYDATLGGSLAKDRLWFFASASVLPAHTIDWRNIELPAAQTSAPAELPSSLFLLRGTGFFSESSVLNVTVTRQ